MEAVFADLVVIYLQEVGLGLVSIANPSINLDVVFCGKKPFILFNRGIIERLKAQIQRVVRVVLALALAIVKGVNLHIEVIRNSPKLVNNYSTVVGISSPMLSIAIRAALGTGSSSHFPFAFVARTSHSRFWSVFTTAYLESASLSLSLA